MSTIVKTKPTSPGRRAQEYLSFEEITKEKPERRLTKNLNKRSGRNSYGRITAKHRGGGAKKKYRIIDFKRDKDGIPAKVSAIEYDPNRSARIALLTYADGEKRYILAPLDVKVGDKIMFGKYSGTEVKVEGEDLLIMKESDILGIIEDAAAAKAA